MGVFDLKGFDSVKETSDSNELLDSIVEWLDWGLLQKNNYFNVPYGKLDNSGKDLSKLKLSTDKRFAEGRSWEAIRPNWVWQDLEVEQPPTVASGVRVNGTFYPLSTTGMFAHYIDYFNGRVVFNSPISKSSIVQVEHSYKYISILYSNAFFEGITVFNSEDSNLLSTELVSHLPVIAVEVVSKPGHRPYQLGGGQFMEYLVLFHCVATSDTVRNMLVDIVSFQNDKTILTFNTNKLAQNQEMPIDYRGMPTPNAMNYKEIVTKYPDKIVRLQKVNSSEIKMPNNSYFGGVVKLTAELIKTSI